MTSKIQFRGATSGFVELAAPDAAGSNTLILPSGTGASGDFISTDGNGSLSFAPSVPTNLGTAATASGTDLQFNSGFGSVATAYGVRAWANWRGDISSGGNSQISGSANVTSVTDNGTGDYTINFTNAMPDGNYVVVGNCMEDLGGSRGDHFLTMHRTQLATGSCRVTVINAAGTVLDDDFVWAAIIR
jgi:hypothetical protein